MALKPLIATWSIWNVSEPGNQAATDRRSGNDGMAGSYRVNRKKEVCGHDIAAYGDPTEGHYEHEAGKLRDGGRAG